MRWTRFWMKMKSFHIYSLTTLVLHVKLSSSTSLIVSPLPRGAFRGISCDDLRCVIWCIGISCAIYDSSCLSPHHRLFPRTNQSRLVPALIWEIHIAEAAAGWPRGWHCHHLVMTTTAGVAQILIIAFEDTSVLDRSTFCLPPHADEFYSGSNTSFTAYACASLLYVSLKCIIYHTDILFITAALLSFAFLFPIQHLISFFSFSALPCRYSLSSWCVLQQMLT